MFNQRAIKTYEKVGFQKFEQTVGEIGEKTFECMHMRKSL
jgi:ribosomal protein S18 acetylase RimI-like enzyme